MRIVRSSHLFDEKKISPRSEPNVWMWDEPLWTDIIAGEFREEGFRSGKRSSASESPDSNSESSFWCSEITGSGVNAGIVKDPGCEVREVGMSGWFGMDRSDEGVLLGRTEIIGSLWLTELKAALRSLGTELRGPVTCQSWVVRWDLMGIFTFTVLILRKNISIWPIFWSRVIK